MRLQAESGCTQAFVDFMQANPIRPDRETITGRVFMDGKPVHVPDVQTDPEYNFGQRASDRRLPHGARVPLMRDGAVEGVLLLGKAGARAVQPDARSSWSQTFADQAVIAIENVRLFERGAGAHQGTVALARRSAHRAGPPGADREARLARPAHRRHRARDQEPAQLRQQFLGAVGGTDRRAERCAQAGRARRQDARGDRRTHPHAEGQSREGGAARQARRFDRQEHAAAFARGFGRAPARRYQRDRRGKPQSRLSRRAGREVRLQHHAASATSIRPPA